MGGVIVMISYQDLVNCKKSPTETWVEYKNRYNKIVDELNLHIPKKEYQYSKLLLIIDRTNTS